MTGTLQKRAKEALESTKDSQPVSKVPEDSPVSKTVENEFKQEQPKPENNDLPW
jgi:hypothetical protein